MLDLALNHKDELQTQIRKTWFDEKYKYWVCSTYHEDLQIEESTWNKHQFVSLDVSRTVIGYIGYHIDRENNYVSGLSIINFSDNKTVFGLDVGKAITEIFNKFHFRKLCFSVIIGNPIESTYDRLIDKYGGRIVGIQKDHIRLIDNKYYDKKMYEIFANN